MEKKNWMDEDIRFDVDIHRYFNKDLPIRFDIIQNEFNIEIIGCNFDVIQTDERVKKVSNIENIAGMVSISDEKIILYYNNNDNKYSKKEQRFILANLFAYCENLGKTKRESIVKDYEVMMKCDQCFDGMTAEEFVEFVNNKVARQILMPKKQFELRYGVLHGFCDDETNITALSENFMVPEREVIIRGSELGIDFDVELDMYKEERQKKVLSK